MEIGDKLFINTDGGSRGNPGPAAIGLAFFDSKGSVIYSYKETIGVATNNEAEYLAIIKALEILLKSNWFKSCNHESNKSIVCRLDSKLVVEQINGNYKIKQEHIKAFIGKITSLLKEIKIEITFVHIRREENKIADKLVNEALDNK